MKRDFLYRRYMKGRLMYNIDPRRESQMEGGWYFCISFLRRIQPEIPKAVLAYLSPKDDQLLRFSVVMPHKYQHQSPLEIIARLNRGASEAVVYRIFLSRIRHPPPLQCISSSLLPPSFSVNT